MRSVCFVSIVSALALAAAPADAQTPPTDSPAEAAPATPAEPTPAAAPSTPAAPAEPRPPEPPPAAAPAEPEARDGLTWSGSAEAFYGYNLNNPSNNITAFRYYDDRHNLFSIQNVLVDAAWRYGRVSGHLRLQLGVYPETFFAPARSLELDLLWRLIQEVTIQYRSTVGRGLAVEAGLYVAPYTIEDMATHQNWNWSYSNLFAAAPFHMAGARVIYPLTPRVQLSGGVYNGWDQIQTDETPYKTALFAMDWEDGDERFFTAQYSVGVERVRGAPEGARPRHTLDLYGGVQLSRRWRVRGNVFAGYEPTVLGAAGWVGVAAYAQVTLRPWLFLAARADVLHERIPDGAEALFLGDGVATIGSGTLTLDARPVDHVSFKLEYRHDESDGDLFYRGAVSRDMTTMDWIANARRQDTVLAGMSVWF